MGDTRKAESDLGWTTLLRELRRDEAEEPPEGWKTANQIAGEIGRSRSHTVKMLQHAIELGSAERRIYQEWKGTRMFPTPHYRMIEK